MEILFGQNFCKLASTTNPKRNVIFVVKMSLKRNVENVQKNDVSIWIKIAYHGILRYLSETFCVYKYLNHSL